MTPSAAPPKELSGHFMSSERWAAALLSLQHPSSAVSHVRLFHNTARQVCELLEALLASAACTSSSNTPVTRLFIGDLAPVGAKALGTFLASPHCMLNILELQNLGGSSDGDGSIRSWAGQEGKGFGAQTTNRQEQPLTGAAMASAALAPGLRAASSLTELQLQRCHDQAALTTLVDALASRPLGAKAAASMQLGLQRCRIGTGVASLLGDLAASGTAPVLSLSSCQLPDSQLHSFLSAVRLCPPSLQHLDLSSNAIGPDGAAALSSLLPLAPHLTTLVLEGNTALSDEGAAALAHGAALAPSLAHLDLSDCGIGAAGAAALAAALASGAVLRRLRLDRNAVGADGLLALAAAVHSGRCSLRELGLEACHISGAKLRPPERPSAPPAASPLHVLRLGGNVLGDSGVAWLVQTLLGGPGGSSGLRGLDICDTDIGDAGAEQLIALLAASPQLQSLLMDRSSLQDRGAARLCAAALQHPQLRSFSAKGGRHMGMSMRTRAAEAASLVAQRAAAAGPCESQDTAMQEPVAQPRAAAGAATAYGAALGAQPAPRSLSPPAPFSSQPAVEGGMDCMDRRCSGAMEGLELQLRSSFTDGPVATPKPNPGAAAKHRLEPDQQDSHAAKHHHVQATDASSAAAAGPAEAGALPRPDAHWLPSSWQSVYQAAPRATAGLQGKTFTGCSATSLGGTMPTSPTSAHCGAYVTVGAAQVGRGEAGPGAGAADRRAEKLAASQRGSAESSGSEGSCSDAFGGDRCSAGSAGTGPGSCTGIRGYGRRFRPLSQQQQLLFADF